MLSHPEPANGLCGFFTVSELALDNEKEKSCTHQKLEDTKKRRLENWQEHDYNNQP